MSPPGGVGDGGDRRTGDGLLRPSFDDDGGQNPPGVLEPKHGELGDGTMVPDFSRDRIDRTAQLIADPHTEVSATAAGAFEVTGRGVDAKKRGFWTKLFEVLAEIFTLGDYPSRWRQGAIDDSEWRANAASTAAAGGDDLRTAFLADGGEARARARFADILGRLNPDINAKERDNSADALVRHLSTLYANTTPGQLRIARRGLLSRGVSMSERKTIAEVMTHPGFAAMAVENQSHVLRLIGGSNRQFAEPARQAMAALLRDEDFREATPAEQARELDAFARGFPTEKGNLRPPRGLYDGRGVPTSIEGPTNVPAHDFRTGEARAKRYVVVVEGQRIPVFIAAHPNRDGGHHHTIEEVADSLGALPAEHRRRVAQVNLNPEQKPRSERDRRRRPDHRAYMSAGASGIINVYPSRHDLPQDRMITSMIHELGHIVTNQLWTRKLGAPGWQRWQRAIDRDPIAPSTYARTNAREDFSEFFELYYQVVGTPQEAEMRALFPARFRILDEILVEERRAANNP